MSVKSMQSRHFPFAFLTRTTLANHSGYSTSLIAFSRRSLSTSSLIAFCLCHAPLPDPTRMADPNRVRARDYILGLIDPFFLRAELILVVIQTNLCNNKNHFHLQKKLPPEWCPSKSILLLYSCALSSFTYLYRS